jgi:hypothetical protein
MPGTVTRSQHWRRRWRASAARLNRRAVVRLTLLKGRRWRTHDQHFHRQQRGGQWRQHLQQRYGHSDCHQQYFSGNSATSSGGGIYNALGTTTVYNTIVANSTAGRNCSGTITNGGNNIDDETTCGWGSSNGSMSSTNPLLGVLTNNGGPTQTMALLAGSPAIDGVVYNAPNGCPATDQRGLVRPIGPRCDIGVYEYGFLAYLPFMAKNYP